MTASPQAAPADAAAAARPRLILVDGHVHIYPCFAIEAVLAAALRNFRAAAAALGAAAFDGVLMLTESAGCDAFRMLRRAREIAGWRLSPTDDGLAVRAAGEQGVVTLVAGRQIVAAEGVEVSALGTDRLIADGLPLERCLDEVATAGAVPVLPWGVGKWFGGRGRVVAKAMWRPRAFRVLPGDIGGRPRVLPTPPLLRRAERQGLTIVRGTDPLPLPAEAKRAGAFGIAFPGQLDRAHPAAQLKGLLLARRPQPYGELERLGRFLVNQTQLRRR